MRGLAALFAYLLSVAIVGAVLVKAVMALIGPVDQPIRAAGASNVAASAAPGAATTAKPAASTAIARGVKAAHAKHIARHFEKTRSARNHVEPARREGDVARRPPTAWTAGFFDGLWQPGT